MCERFGVGEQGKIPTFEEEPEVSHDRVSRQEFMVKGGVTGLSRGQLPGEEGEGSPGSLNQLLKNCSHV